MVDKTVILAVDDSLSIREMVAFTLRADGHDVVTAEDGVDALRIARDQRIDVVVTDVNMPNMDGITLVRELRGMEKFRFTPLLILTTESSSEYKQKGRAAGATGWLVKPFQPEQLQETVRRVLG